MGIHKFTRLIDQNKTIQMYGDGTSSRDYTFIDDIIQGIVKSTEKISGYNTYNLGNNKPVNLLDLIKIIANALSKDYNLETVDMQPGDVNHTLADISHAQNDLGYQPTTSIEEGIKVFIKWYYQSNNLKV